MKSPSIFTFACFTNVYMTLMLTDCVDTTMFCGIVIFSSQLTNVCTSYSGSLSHIHLYDSEQCSRITTHIYVTVLEISNYKTFKCLGAIEKFTIQSHIFFQYEYWILTTLHRPLIFNHHVELF